MMHASKLLRRKGVATLGMLLTMMVVTPRSARADADDVAAPKTDNRARAQQLFDSALADAEAGNLAAACPKFLASQEADPKTSTLLNLASCYEKNGQTASAWGAFREAEGLSRKVGRADWEATARSHAERLETRLVRLTVQVPESSRVAGLTVARDGARIGAGEWGVAIPVDPGEHLVVASAAGRASWEIRAAIREASGTIVVPLLEPLPEPKEPPTVAPVAPVDRASPPAWWTPLRTAGVVAAGVGVVGLVTGSILGIVAKSKYDSAHALCNDGARACPPSAVTDSDSAYGLATGATAVFVIGAVAAAGGAALIVFAPAPQAQSGNAKPGGASAALHVGPGSLGVHGRW